MNMLKSFKEGIGKIETGPNEQLKKRPIHWVWRSSEDKQGEESRERG